jgi:hypothetical protein
MRRALLIVALGLLFIGAAEAVVPSSALTSAVNAVVSGGSPTSSELKNFATAVRDNFVDVQNQLNALVSRAKR